MVGVCCQFWYEFKDDQEPILPMVFGILSFNFKKYFWFHEIIIYLLYKKKLNEIKAKLFSWGASLTFQGPPSALEARDGFSIVVNLNFNFNSLRNWYWFNATNKQGLNTGNTQHHPVNSCSENKYVFKTDRVDQQWHIWSKQIS